MVMSVRAKKWFDQLESVLTQEAILAGLVGHNGLIGSAREFFVRRILRSILPPAVHIGSGRVIGDKAEEESKQIDVVLYDPRCPFLETEPGIGLYFAEGVIATIEVKSTLTKPILKDALDNCLSVMEISTHFTNQEEPVRRCQEIAQKRGVCMVDAQEIMKWEMVPRTYIFAFNTDMTSKAIGDTVAEWYDGRGESPSPYHPFLPRLIAAPRTVAIQNDGWLKQSLGVEFYQQVALEHGPKAQVVMPVYPTHRHFGWLAFHLIHSIHERLGLEYRAGRLQFPIEQYLGIDLYGQELREGEPAVAVIWTGKPAGCRKSDVGR